MLLFYVLVFWPQGMWNLSSLTRDRTCIPCIERQILINGITRAVPCGNSLNILIITAFCMDLLQITTSSLCCLSIDLLVGIFHEIVVSQLERTHTHTHTHTTSDTDLVVVQSLSHVQLFVTPLIAWQPPQSSTVSRSLLRFMSIESVMSFSYLIQSELVLGTRTRGSNSVHSLLGSQCPLWGQAVACKKEKKKKSSFLFCTFLPGINIRLLLPF